MSAPYRNPAASFDLHRLAARAMPLGERLADPAHWGEPDGGTERLLAQWQDQTGRGFARRLAWSGIAPEDLPRLLSTPRYGAAGETPPWLPIVEEVIAEARRAPHDASASPLCDTDALLLPRDAGEPLPFEDLLWPMIRVARHRLRGALAPLRHRFGGDLTSLMADTAYAMAERTLLAQLANLSEKAFGLEFARGRPLTHNLLGLLPGDPPRENYRRFVADHLAHGLTLLFDAYPVLARLVGIAIGNWCAEFAEFAHRLAGDRESIADGAEIGAAVALSQDLSDPHRGGRSVRIVTFANGRRAVYKPRSVKPEIGLDAILAWCNARGASPPLARIRHLDRGAYGWALDCVAAAPCADASAAARFYRRAGMLLCIAYVLDANDLHSENLIAAGEHPIVVDAETLMHPRMTPPDAAPEDIAIVANSVLRTGLLPRWSFGGDGRVAFDISALGRPRQQDTPWPVLRWQAINSDFMTLAPRTVPLPPNDNAPVLDGAELSAADHVDAICDGFAGLYRILVQHRAELSGAPLAALRDQPVRFLFRPTEVYGALLAAARMPQALGDGAARSIVLDEIATPFLGSGEPPPAWPLIAAERDALEDLDIPYFETRASSRTLCADGRPIAALFDKSGFDCVLENLARLDDNDLAYQTRLIRGSFAAQSIQVSDTPAARTDAPPPACFAPAQFLDRAAQIAGAIADQAIDDGKGHVGWLAIRYAEAARRYQFEPVGFDLYDGRCGIALFLAALDATRGTDAFRALVLKSLEPARRLARGAKAGTLDLGAGTGLGGIVYALTRIGVWTGAPALLDDAATAASAIDAGTLARDAKLDVIGGAAGAILGLLALYRETKDESVLARAAACGDHLLAQQLESGAWHTIAERPLTGFSHGAAGIAYALQRLYAATSAARFAKAAAAAIAFEQGCYDAAARNWPDYRRGDDAFAMSWCHGAPGIGLARLGGTAAGDDIENALSATRAAGSQGVDHLCCGTLGMAETLLTAGLQLQRPDLVQAARDLGTGVCVHAGEAGGYRLLPGIAGGALSPGLFQGMAGVGYELLRLAQPDRVPSVLLWE